MTKKILMLSLIALMAPFISGGEIPVPDSAAQDRAETAVKSIFKDDFLKRSSADRQQLAAKLLTEASKTSDDPAAKFALLKQSAEVSASASDIAGLGKAIDALSDAFAVDAAAMEAEILIKMPPAPATPQAAGEVATAYADLIDRLVGQDGNDLILRLAPMGSAASRKAHNADLLARIQTAERAAREFQTETGRFKTAQATLAANPENAEANLAAGRFLCFSKHDWNAGLAYLAKASDPSLKVAAQRDIENPTEPKQQSAVGDGWYELAAKETSKSSQAAMRARAGKWYAEAVTHMPGLERVKVEKRLADIQQPPASVGQPASPAKAADATATSLSAEKKSELQKERALILDDAKTQTDSAKHLTRLMDAAKITLQLDPKAGIAELDDVISKASGDADRIGDALIIEGQYFGSRNNWVEAEARLSRCWKEFRGSYGDRGCAAAAVLADHYAELKQFDRAISYKLIIMDCNGSYGGPAGDAGLWLSDYYLAKKDKPRAVLYLKEVVTKHGGPYGNCKKKAIEKLTALGEKAPAGD